MRREEGEVRPFCEVMSKCWAGSDKFAYTVTAYRGAETVYEVEVPPPPVTAEEKRLLRKVFMQFNVPKEEREDLAGRIAMYRWKAAATAMAKEMSRKHGWRFQKSTRALWE